jgi:hypothetical protein
MKKIDFNKLDKKSRIELAITSVAILVLIIISTSSIKGILRAKKKISEVGIIEPAAVRDILRRDMAILSEYNKPSHKEIGEKSDMPIDEVPWGRDPFLPQGAAGEDGTALYDIRLEGIMWDEAKPTAVINGGIYETGDEVRNMEILEIRKDSILLGDGSKEYNIKLR